MTFHLHMLRNAHTREELAICWRVFSACARAWPDGSWEEVKEAFKLRAEEMGLKWAERS